MNRALPAAAWLDAPGQNRLDGVGRDFRFQRTYFGAAHLLSQPASMVYWKRHFNVRTVGRRATPESAKT